MHFNLILTILILQLACGQLRAELRDPTRPGDLPPEILLAEEARLKLSMIKIAGRQRWAIIDGQTVRVGQTLPGNIKIVKIDPNYVLIKQDGIIRKLTLLANPFARQ